MKDKTIRDSVRKASVIFVIACIMVAFMCPECYSNWNYLWRYVLITYSIWIVMWFGNSIVGNYFGGRYSWLNQPVKRFLTEISVIAIYSLLAMLFLIWFYKAAMNIDIGGNDPSFVLYLSVIISVVVFMALLAKEFLFSWRELALREEKMKNEVLSSNFQMLKNQVNPHFMFNSLNTLKSLISSDQNLASEYVGQLSKVYRSVLTSSTNEIVSLKEELKVLESYVFLQSIRFEDCFKVQIEFDEEALSKCVPPMVLQMLIENAIKHNVMTIENPLIIQVYSENSMVCVKNKIESKQVLPGDNSSVGLANIRARYELLTQIPVEVTNNDAIFIVKLPLLTLE